MTPSYRTWRCSGLAGVGLVLLGLTLLTADEPIETPLVAPEPAAAATEVPLSVELPKEWMEPVEVIPKSGLGILEDEAASYYRILDHVRKLTPEQLREGELKFRNDRIDAYIRRIDELYAEEAPKDKAYAETMRGKRQELSERFRKNPFEYPLVVDAFNRPSECAGRVVSFKGYARQPKRYPAGENANGIEELCELWLFDEESPRLPVVVVCTEFPPDFPLNLKEKDVIDGISVRGYFFKMYAYPGQERLQAVPMILAHNITWNPPVATPWEMPGWSYGLLALIGVVLIGLIIRSRRRDPHLQQVRERLKPLDENPFSDV